MTRVKAQERPIVLDATEVRAILDGRKTQLRRVARNVAAIVGGVGYYASGPKWKRMPDYRSAPVACPWGGSGNRLWAKETWARDVYGCPGGLSFRTDHDDPNGDGPANPMRWRSPVTMPRDVSRILLEVTRIRLERLLDVDEDSVLAEGARYTDYGYRNRHGLYVGDPRFAPRPVMVPNHGWAMGPTRYSDECLGTSRAAFANWWNTRHGKRATWESNPFVWVITFRKIEE